MDIRIVLQILFISGYNTQQHCQSIVIIDLAFMSITINNQVKVGILVFLYKFNGDAEDRKHYCKYIYGNDPKPGDDEVCGQ